MAAKKGILIFLQVAKNETIDADNFKIK